MANGKIYRYSIVRVFGFMVGALWHLSWAFDAQDTTPSWGLRLSCPYTVFFIFQLLSRTGVFQPGVVEDGQVRPAKHVLELLEQAPGEGAVEGSESSDSG